MDEIEKIKKAVNYNGFAFSFDDLKIPHYYQWNEEISVVAFKNNEKYEFVRIWKKRSIPVLTLIELSTQELNIDRLKEEVIKGGIDDDIEDGNIIISVELFLYVKETVLKKEDEWIDGEWKKKEEKKESNEKKYYIISDDACGYRIIYSQNGELFTDFDWSPYEENNLPFDEIYKDTLIIPWLFSTSPSKEISEKLATY